MSIEFGAILDHNFNSFSDLEKFRLAMQNKDPKDSIFRNFIEKNLYKHSEEWIWNWHLPTYTTDPEQIWINDNDIDLIGPKSSFGFTGKTYYIGISVFWDNFLRSELLRSNLRKAIHDLAKEFHSSKAIYIPNKLFKTSNALDFHYEIDNDINDIIEQIDKICGKPLDIDFILEPDKNYSDSFFDNIYFIDNLLPQKI